MKSGEWGLSPATLIIHHKEWKASPTLARHKEWRVSNSYPTLIKTLSLDPNFTLPKPNIMTTKYDNYDWTELPAGELSQFEVDLQRSLCAWKWFRNMIDRYSVSHWTVIDSNKWTMSRDFECTAWYWFGSNNIIRYPSHQILCLDSPLHVVDPCGPPASPPSSIRDFVTAVEYNNLFCTLVILVIRHTHWSWGGRS